MRTGVTVVFIWLCRLLALACAAYIIRSAVSPPGGPGLFPWDKAAHFTAFYVMSGLTALSLPRVSYWKVALAMLAFGGLIEVLQGLPQVGRDADIVDLVADALGIAAALGPPFADRVRRHLAAGGANG